MIEMRSFISAIVLFFAILVITSGCTGSSPHDGPVEVALNVLLGSEEFTQEEREAVNSIKVHNETCWVWLKKDWTQEAEKITALAVHVGEAFSREFWDKAMEHGYKAPKYMVQVWMKIPGEEGYHDALVVDAWWDTMRNEADMEKYGLSEFKDIR
jgi:hypothetical protein